VRAATPRASVTGDSLAQIELRDELGFDTAWVGELHFSRASSILGDHLMVLAAAAQRLGLFRKNKISDRDEADTAQARR
jgi:alkanesulfonate monooxygenase SsuD/methylene tetrahydromethanopterin reductase-like flavin-dependent oxidoreductase (luciferase family)